MIGATRAGVAGKSEAPGRLVAESTGGSARRLPGAGGSLLRSSSRRRRLADAPLGRANESSGFHPHAAWPGRTVHQRGCCGSDWVADQPSALHAEAPDRRGSGNATSRIRSSGEVASRIDERLSPWLRRRSPRIFPRAGRNGVVEIVSLTPFPSRRGEKYGAAGDARKRRSFFGLAHLGVHRLCTLTATGWMRSAGFHRNVKM